MQPQLNAPQFLQVQKQYALNERHMYRVGELLAAHALTRLPNGNFQVRSLSRPDRYHQVNPLYESCTCEHARKENLCIHLTAWLIVRKMTVQEWQTYAKEARTAAQQAQSVRQSAEIIERREIAKKLEDSRRPRVEWVEELDLT